jgi:putrescine transport system ATP-binding protein
VKRPRVLLLDEPLSALDRKLREETRFELIELQHKVGLTFIMVTHDQDEAMAMSDRIGVMHQGRLAQVGPPAQVYEQPSSRWVAGFVGDVNLIEGLLVETGPSGSVLECTGLGRMDIARQGNVPSGTTLWVALRPERIELTELAPAAAGGNCFAGHVLDVGYLGDLSTYRVKLASGLVLKASAANRSQPRSRRIARGDNVFASWPADAAVVLAP